MTSDQWMINLTFAPDVPVEDEEFEAIADRFDDLDWEFATGPYLDLVVTIYLGHDESAFQSMPMLHDQARQELRDIGVVAVLVKCEAMTEDRRNTEAFIPQIPELVTATDAARILDVTRQRVNQLHHEHVDFPAPVVKTGSCFLWTQTSVERFARVWDRRPGHRAGTRDPDERAAVVQLRQHDDHDEAGDSGGRDRAKCCEA